MPKIKVLNNNKKISYCNINQVQMNSNVKYLEKLQTEYNYDID